MECNFRTSRPEVLREKYFYEVNFAGKFETKKDRYNIKSACSFSINLTCFWPMASK